MTSEFNDVQLNIYGETLNAPFKEAISAPGFRALPFRYSHPLSRIVLPWEITIDDLRGGLAQDDNYSRSYAGWSSSTADPRFRRYLMNPLLTTSTTFSSGSSEGNGGVFFVNHNKVLILAKGSGANISMFKETSSSDPTPVAVTYSPGAAITCLLSGPIGGSTAAKRLFVGRSNTTTDVHSTAGTSLGTQHANLNSLWGGAISSVNAATPGTPTWLWYANTGIYYSPITDAIGAAPTQALSNVPAGGTVLGFETLAKSPWGNRCYMLWPEADGGTTSSWSTGGASNPQPCRLIHISAEGTDPQEVKWSLTHILFGRLWQRHAVCSDGVRVVKYEGEVEEDLRIFNNVSANSDLKYAVVGLGGDAGTLRALVQIGNLATATAAAQILQQWEYLPQTKSWVTVSAQQTPYSYGAATDGAFWINGIHTIWYGPNLPYSEQTGATYTALVKTTDQAWNWQLMPPTGVNPYNLYRQTGASANASKAFETSAVHTLPKWTLPSLGGYPAPGLAGFPSVIEELDLRGCDPEGGGSGASVKLEVATQGLTSLAFSNNLSLTVSTTDPIKERRRRFGGNTDYFNKLQAQFTLTSAAANKTPNALPAVIRGMTFLDGVTRTPDEVRQFLKGEQP